MQTQSGFTHFNFPVQAKTGTATWQVTGVLAISFIFSMSVGPCYAVEAPTHEHQMSMDMKDMKGMDMKDMNMDDSGHEHAMGHSGHEHHMSSKPGLLSRSVHNYQVPKISMVDMKNDKFALDELLSRESPIILNFIFTSCTTICPVMSNTFQQVQKQLEPKQSKYRMVSISIDPENDTPEKLREYASRFGAAPQWTLLTGSLDNSIAAQKNFKVFAGDKMDQKPVTFLKAKGSESSWVRLDGLVDARMIVQEFDKLNSR